MNSHKLIVDKLEVVLNVYKDNVDNDNVHLKDFGDKKPPNHTSHTS